MFVQVGDWNLDFKRVSNLMPLLSWIAKTEFLEVLTNLSNALLNDIDEGNDLCYHLSDSILESSENVLLMLTVFEGVIFTIFFSVDLVWLIGLSGSCRYVKYWGESPFMIL